MGTHDVTITQLASKGTYFGRDIGQDSSFTVAAGENKLVLRVDGVTSSPISIDAGVYENGSKLADAIQNQINKDEVLKRENVSVSVSYVVGQMVITSNRLGGQSRVDVISADNNIKDLGIDPADGIAGNDIAGRIGRLGAEAQGQTLTGTGDAAGIKIEVIGGREGTRGNVSFSMGVAEQLSNTLERYIGNQGVLQTRSEGLNRRIEDINKQRDQLARRLETSEKRLMKQFSSLDATLGKMRSTSNFLSSRLAALPGARDSNN